MSNNNKTALIAMSGGVDSSVAAYLMVSRGYDCIGTTMRLYSNDDAPSCCSQRDINDASAIADKLGFPYEVLDFTFDFREQIIGKFIKTYEAGGTPNPCVDCNRCMKFGKLHKFAAEKGMYYVVTGHYARIEERNGRYLLKKAADLSKDQSYVLYSLTQEQLKHTLFPLGEMSKNDARKIAEAQGFTNSDKPDSQDICFVPDGDYVGFMESYTGKKYPEGDFLDENGNPVGKHSGAVRYTIGQRKGLRLSMGRPVYVFDKDMEKNTVSVGDEELLFSKGLIADEMNWIAFDKLTEPLHIKAKTRYRQTEQEAVAEPLDNGRIRLIFDKPQRAVTIGQAVVLYDGDTVVGGGTITEVIR